MIAETDPVAVVGDEFVLLQSCFTTEGEDADERPSFEATNDDYSGGEAAIFQGDDQALAEADFGEWEFVPPYDIPGEHFTVWVRDWDDGDPDGAPAFSWYLDHADGETYDLNSVSAVGALLSLNWSEVGGDDYDGDGYDGPDLVAGETHTLRVVVDDSDGLGDQYSYTVDVVAPLDERYPYDLDNSVHEPNGYLNGPELFPDQVVVEFEPTPTRRDVISATVSQSWNDTSGDQFIQVTNDGGSTWLPDDGSEENTESISVAFPTAETGVQTRVGMGRYGGPQNATPRFGFEGQAIDTHELRADVDAITPDGTGAADVQGTVAPGTITNETLREAAQLTEADEALTRAAIADVEVAEDMRVYSAERIFWKNP